VKKETSCINTKAIFEYVKKFNHGDCSLLLGNLGPEIDGLPDPEGFFRDPNNWISCTVIRQLYERARSILNDNMVAYKMAEFAIKNYSLGYIQKVFIKAFWSHIRAVKHIQKINDKFNRSKRVELVKARGNEAVVRLHWDHEMDVSRDMCLNNQGYYTHMPLIWGGRPVNFEETYCYFEGDPYCEYHMKWPVRDGFHAIFSRIFTSKTVLMETIVEMETDKQLIEQKYEEVNSLNVELNQKIKQIMALQETGKAILSVLDLDQVLIVIMNILSNVCEINRALIMIVNEEGKYLEYLQSVGFNGAVPEEVRNYRVPLNRVSNILVRVTSTGRSEYIPEIESSNLKKENVVLSYGKPTSAYVVPLITRSKVIGVIATDAVNSSGIPKETRETLEIFAPQIAIAIENARLYSRLQEQMEELKKSHALLSRAEKFSFLGNIAARLAHEIKNPMTAIGTFIQMLPRKYDDEEFRKNFYEIAMEETTRVNDLITELLDLVKTKTTHFEFNDLHALIDRMILLISPQSNEKKIEVIRYFDTDIGRVWLDSEKIKQVILNILSNAVEFTPQGGKIEISTKNLAENGMQESIRIEIKDNGTGISESIIDKIFDPYFSTKHKSNVHNGTGLGLSIAYQNMKEHGGSIEVKSEVKKGAAFILRLPSDPSRLNEDMGD
jgi:signal transduction histidine kinase